MTVKLKKSITANGVTVTLSKQRETQKAILIRYSIFVKPINKTFNLKAVWIPKSLIVGDTDDYIELSDDIKKLRKDWLDSLPDIIRFYDTSSKLYSCAFCHEKIQFPQLILLEFKGNEVKDIMAFCSWMCLFDASGCEISGEGEKK